ncbi:MAG: DUF4402 domain-containing protein [Pseudomonadota bacterium]
MAACASAGAAQNGQSVDSRAEIVADVTLRNTADLDYGRLIVPRNGRVDMTAEETPTCTPINQIQLLDACQSARFEGTAAPGFQLRVRVPSGRRINMPGPGQDLRLRRMTVGAGDGLGFIRRDGRNFEFNVTDPVGEFEFFVAGRLLFRNNQAPGLYEGTFDIEVEYQ